MFTPAIFCLAPSRGRADRIIQDLKDAAFSKSEIGVLFFDRHNGADRMRPPLTPALSAVANQSAGPIRGVLAWLAGVGQLVVPGVGSFIAAGPIITAIHEARNGALGVAIARGLIRLGVPPADAALYEQKIKTDGQFLISVHTAIPARILRARRIFGEADSREIDTPQTSMPVPAVPGSRTPVRGETPSLGSLLSGKMT